MTSITIKRLWQRIAHLFTGRIRWNKLSLLSNYNNNGNNKRKRISMAVIPFLFTVKIHGPFGKWFHHFRANVFPVYRSCSFSDVKATSGVEYLSISIYGLGQHRRKTARQPLNQTQGTFAPEGLKPKVCVTTTNIRDFVQQFHQNEAFRTMNPFLILTAIFLKISALFAPTEGKWYFFLLFSLFVI